MNILFRADSSAQIGIGHIMRCLTLADELVRQGHNCWFICRDHLGHASALIAAKGHGLTMLPASNMADDISSFSCANNYAQWLGVAWQEDAEQTKEVLNQFKADWLVVDHYALDCQWQRAVSSSVGQIMVIDDLANREHDCALLLDQNQGRNDTDYSALVPSGCKCLIGPRYALLRPEFSELREFSLQRRQNAELKRVLIALGGVDQHNVTGKVLSTLANSDLPRMLQLDVVLGATASHIQAVREQLLELPFIATLSVDVTDMAQRMSHADVAIGAAGGSAWERCCLGLPSLLIVLADNQMVGAAALAATNAALLIPSIDTIAEALPEQFEQISNSNRLALMSAAAANITAGRGIYAVVNAMNGVAKL